MPLASSNGSTANLQEDGPSIVTAQLSLPKDGGVIRGMGEKFAASLVRERALTIPIYATPGRSGFGPLFSLS